MQLSQEVLLDRGTANEVIVRERSGVKRKCSAGGLKMPRGGSFQDGRNNSMFVAFGKYPRMGAGRIII